MSEWKCSYKACECSSDAEKSECDLSYKTNKMSEEEKQDIFLSSYFLGMGSGVLLGITIGFYFM